MAKLEQLIINRKQRKHKNRGLTEKQRRQQVRDWTTFYRRNWNIYAKYELSMKSLRFLFMK